MLDSESNTHYYNDISLFVEYAEYHNRSYNQGTHTADRLTPDLPVKGIGKVKLEINKSDRESNEFLISDVYYTPSVRINIISPDVLLDKSGIYGTWTKREIILINKEDDEITSAIR